MKSSRFALRTATRRARCQLHRRGGLPPYWRVRNAKPVLASGCPQPVHLHLSLPHKRTARHRSLASLALTDTHAETGAQSQGTRPRSRSSWEGPESRYGSAFLTCSRHETFVMGTHCGTRVTSANKTTIRETRVTEGQCPQPSPAHAEQLLLEASPPGTVTSSALLPRHARQASPVGCLVPREAAEPGHMGCTNMSQARQGTSNTPLPTIERFHPALPETTSSAGGGSCLVTRGAGREQRLRRKHSAVCPEGISHLPMSAKSEEKSAFWCASVTN